MLYNPVTRELDNGSEKDLFDDSGRLIRKTDAYDNHMDITYTSGRIASVKDGAGRAFGFVYNTSGNLTSITAPDGTSVQYGYTGNLLSSVTYPDGSKAEITSSSNLPATILLKNSSGASLYKVVYSFSGNSVSKVTESGVENGAFVTGVSSAYSYSAASGSTTVQTTEPKDTEEGETTDTVTKTVYTFDDDGNVVSEYVYTQDTGNVGASGEESGIRPHSGNGVVSNINNLLTGHQFDALSAWASMPGNSKDTSIQSYASEAYAQFGRKVLRMESSNTASTNNGMYQATNVLPAGQYTFSAYLRVLTDFTGATRPGAFLRVTDTAGSVLAESERISKSDTDYVRLAASFALTASKSVQVQILMDGKGAIYADAAQLENNPYVSAYNMLENGNFERGVSGWVKTDGVADSTGTRFNMSHSLTMTGDLDSSRYAYQDVMVKASRSTRETFTLSGWAKGYGLVNHEREYSMEPRFRLYAEVQYNDATYHDTDTEIFAADFSPCTEEWQFASVEFSKSRYREISRIRVYCDYSNNFGTVFFDDIQLVRNNLETGLTASDFVVETSDGSDEAVNQDTSPAFEEQRDKFGNILTETTFRDGEVGTIYHSFGYSADGNNLIRETDARGNKNAYTVDDATSRNKEAVDRLGNKTAYEYDKAGRTTKVTSKNASGTALATVSYAYDGFNNLTEITRGDGMKYALAYNAFHNLESIGINGKSEKLVKYTYKNGNGRLKAMTYANGHTMKATYNSAGQMTAEKWYASSTSTTPIAHYKYVYDGQGNIVRSIDMLQKKEYTYAYDFGRIVRATECDITLNGEVVTGKTLINSILYTYGSAGNLTKKRIVPASGTEQVIYCEHPENEGTVVKFTAGGKTVTSHSKTDSFGRKVFDELQLGTGVVSRRFSYHLGRVTDEHTANGKQKSTPTTQLVSQIVLSDGRTLKYEYDAEDRITKVTDSVDGTTVYTYDSLGQLLTETRNGTVVNTMTYDNYGNIKTKNGKTYTYGDSVWKDKLTAYDGKSITYDAQGNPTSYLGHTLAWEKGRQLKSFDGIAYTYNAAGIRTGKTVSGFKHTYTLDGAKILRETWGSNTLIPLYDNEDSVCGILYNDEPFYFLKNQQGDIIAITDKSGKTVAKYSYDAWGACTVAQDSSAVAIASINPYRYRGYYFDIETGLYYLQSRYYDPSVGRFVNADDSNYVLLGELETTPNLYAYCTNDSIQNSDYTGYTDSTWDLVWLLIKNLAQTKIWKWLPIYGQIKFYKAVRDGGIWDYKLKNRRPSWAKSGSFCAFGRTITTEQLGNLNFGFTGASMGFSPATLFAGGGYVAIKHNASWKDWKYFFDQKEDHLWIALGILAYSVFDWRYLAINNAFRYAIEKVAYTIFLAIYKYFK